MNIGYKHSTRWSFGNTVWHKSTKDKGMIVSISLYPNSEPRYNVIFDDNRNDCVCTEFELTDVEQKKELSI